MADETEPTPKKIQEAIQKATQESLKACGVKEEDQIKEFVLGAEQVFKVMEALRRNNSTSRIGHELNYRDLMMLMALDRVATALIVNANCSMTTNIINALGQALKKGNIPVPKGSKPGKEAK